MKQNFRTTSLSAAELRHSLLLSMTADAAKLRAQAQRIKELRQAKERREGVTISQETAAHEIGVSVRTYRTWEGIGAVLKIENLNALAGYYAVDPSYIVFGEHEPGQTPDLSLAPASVLERNVQELTAAVKRLEEQTRLLRAEAATRDAEVLTQIAEVRQTIRGLRHD